MFICSVTAFLWVTFVIINFSFHRTHNFVKSSESYVQKLWFEGKITLELKIVINSKVEKVLCI